MAIDFPAIQPTSCNFTPPQWSITSSRSQSGVRSYRIWASRPSDAVLELGFENVSENAARAVALAYSQARGPIEELTLPPILFFGISDPSFVAIFQQQASGLSWHFLDEQTPSIERVPGRRYTLRVSLRAELRLS